ncbi:MAG: hypothetical protein ACRCXT_00570 [Paraclostridium sp.]
MNSIDKIIDTEIANIKTPYSNALRVINRIPEKIDMKALIKRNGIINNDIIRITKVNFIKTHFDGDRFILFPFSSFIFT